MTMPGRRRARPRGRRRRQDRRDRARSTRSRARPRCSPGSCARWWRRRSRSARPAASPIRVDETMLDRRRPRRPQHRDCARSIVPSRWPRSARPSSRLEVRRVPAHAGGPRRPQARARGRGVGDPPPRRRPARRRSSSRSCRSRSPAISSSAIEEITHDMAGDGADAPPAAGRRRLGQDRGRARGAARRGAGRLPGRVHGAHRSARRAALPRFGEACSKGSTVARRGVAARRPARAASSCSRTARPRPSAAASRRGSRADEIDILVGTHALLYGDAEFTKLGARGDRRAAPLRCRAARAAEGEGERRHRSRRARDDGHADPAHRGDARLRRSRQVGAARDAARPHADRDRGGRHRARSTRCACGRRLRDRGRRPGTRRTSCARSSKTRERSRPRPRPSSTSGCRPRSSPACGSVCCTASCRRRRRKPVMAAFRAGDLDVLVATTVIEVGVDVPNATVMVVEDADRFGLSQLHQLRGRVGRGADKSWCFLVADPTTADGEARMEAIAASHRRVPARGEGPRDPRRGRGVRREAVGDQRPQARPHPARRGRS